MKIMMLLANNDDDEDEDDVLDCTFIMKTGLKFNMNSFCCLRR
jgi:hypothetical protein